MSALVWQQASPVFAAEQQPATKWQYTQKQEQDGILCVFDELKLKLRKPGTENLSREVRAARLLFTTRIL